MGEENASDSLLQPGDNCRLWGEEKQDDAIWGVYLKKVRYQRPSAIVQIVQATGRHSISGRVGKERQKLGSNGSLSKGSCNGVPATSLSPDSEEDIAHLMWETVRVKVLRAGSLRKIVEAIHNEDTDVQATHLSVFLATYRTFAAPIDVLREIFYLYRHSEDEDFKKSMIDCLHVWLDIYPEDFEHGTQGYNCLQKMILPFSQENHLKSLGLKAQYKLRSKRRMKKAASVHSLRAYSPAPVKTYSLLTIPESHFAQQLTFMDKELFLNLQVWECLGELWKRRDGCKTVIATVDQFNALSGRVVATILLDSSSSLHSRAKCLDKWIRIAQELRQLKNFSSLKAIIAALESNPVFRLSKVWHLISKDRLAIFSQLSQIFSEDNNRMAQRSLLEVEGTAKFPTPSKSPNQKKTFFRVLKGPISSRMTPSDHDMPNGTIPYLGTFLTDLTFIDSALPDTVDNTLINFDKRRKEFEILAQLKLLQGSAKGYRLEEDPYFTTWFNSLVPLDDKTAFQMSLDIQPEKTEKGHHKSDSLTSNSLTENMESGLYRKGSIPSSNESTTQGFLGNGNGSVGTGSSNSFTISPNGESSLVVKVSSPAQGDIMYKSIMIGNSDHSPKVIALALDKLGLPEEDPKNYYLVQMLPQRELKFPTNANIYYALDTTTSPTDIRIEVRRLGSIVGNKSHGQNHNKTPNNGSTNNLNNNDLSTKNAQSKLNKQGVKSKH